MTRRTQRQRARRRLLCICVLLYSLAALAESRLDVESAIDSQVAKQSGAAGESPSPPRQMTCAAPSNDQELVDKGIITNIYSCPIMNIVEQSPPSSNADNSDSSKDFVSAAIRWKNPSTNGGQELAGPDKGDYPAALMWSSSGSAVSTVALAEAESRVEQLGGGLGMQEEAVARPSSPSMDLIYGDSQREEAVLGKIEESEGEGGGGERDGESAVAKLATPSSVTKRSATTCGAFFFTWDLDAAEDYGRAPTTLPSGERSSALSPGPSAKVSADNGICYWGSGGIESFGQCSVTGDFEDDPPLSIYHDGAIEQFLAPGATQSGVAGRLSEEAERHGDTVIAQAQSTVLTVSDDSRGKERSGSEDEREATPDTMSDSAEARDTIEAFGSENPMVETSPRWEATESADVERELSFARPWSAMEPTVLDDADAVTIEAQEDTKRYPAAIAPEDQSDVAEILEARVDPSEGMSAAVTTTFAWDEVGEGDSVTAAASDRLLPPLSEEGDLAGDNGEGEPAIELWSRGFLGCTSNDPKVDCRSSMEQESGERDAKTAITTTEPKDNRCEEVLPVVVPPVAGSPDIRGPRMTAVGVAIRNTGLDVHDVSLVWDRDGVEHQLPSLIIEVEGDRVDAERVAASPPDRKVPVTVSEDTAAAILEGQANLGVASPRRVPPKQKEVEKPEATAEQCLDRSNSDGYDSSRGRGEREMQRIARLPSPAVKVRKRSLPRVASSWWSSGIVALFLTIAVGLGVMCATGEGLLIRL